MLYRRLGGSDIQVSLLGLGGNTFGPPRLDRDASIKVVHSALEMGVTFIDTAIIYGEGNSEIFLGEALADRRDQAVLATKFHLFRLRGEDAAQRIRKHCEESLRKLRTDRIDVFQIHKASDEISTDDLIETLTRLKDEGKIRGYGLSNYASWRLAETHAAASRLDAPQPVSVQNQYSLLHRHAEQELVQACGRYGVSLIPYHPLAGGFLSGKYRRGEAPPPGSRGAQGSPIVASMSNERNWAAVRALEEFAKERGRSSAELAIAWLAARPVVASIIAGVSSAQQLEENLRGAEWVLSADEVAEVDAITDGPENASPEDSGRARSAAR